MSFIQGEKFITLANNKTIFYCPTHDVQKFFALNQNAAPYTLITHNSDMEINFTPPLNVIKWYAQNVNIIDPKIVSLPIGLENNKWFPQERKKERMKELVKTTKQIKNLVYLNLNSKTHPERLKVYALFSKKNWVTTEFGVNGVGFENYIHNVYSHLFVLSPRGNGIDTHRTWECLYMNSIPIEKRNFNNRFFTDLPICFVDDWEEVTEEFLNKEYIRIKTSFWNLEKLTFEYWKRKIQNNE